MATYPGTYIPLGLGSSARASQFIDEYLTPKLLRFRQIESNDEQLTLDYDRETWRCAWGNILEMAPFKIIRAGERMMPDNYEVGYEYGTVTFKDLNAQNQIVAGNQVINMSGPDGSPVIDVMGSYVFDYFPAPVLEGLTVNAINVVNTAGQEASPTQYTLENCPKYWDGVIVDLAFAMCIERLLLDYDLWKGRLVFAIGADAILEGQGGDITSQLTTLKQNAEDRAYKTLDNPKFKAGGYYTSAPTVNYWKAINSPGSSGGQYSGRLRGWKPNRIGR